MLNLTNFNDALQAKINALTATTPLKDVALVSKALELAAGRVAIWQISEAEAVALVRLDAARADQIDAIETAGASKMAEIQTLQVLPISGGALSGPLTAPAVAVSAAAPALSWHEADGTADAKRYDIVADDGKLVHRIVNDAGTLSKVWLEVGRSAASAVWSRYIAAVRSRIITLADGVNITPDFAAGNVFTVTLGGNRTLANPTNVPSDHQGGSIIIRQDATGSRTLSFGPAWKFAGGGVPSLSTTPNAVDRLFYLVVSATEIHAALQKDFR